MRSLLLALALLGAAAHAQPVHPGLSGNALRLALRADYTPATVYGYDDARDVLYAEVDLGADDTLRCVYTGQGVHVPPGVGGRFAACNGDGDGNAQTCSGARNLNAEHAFPQSMGAGSGNARSDLHHLFPARTDVNSSRGNDPYADIPDGDVDRWYRLGETLETPPPAAERPLYSQKDNGRQRFEPRDAVKGDIARAIFYFYTIYHAQADADFFDQMKDVLRAWNTSDPPDDTERARSAAIARHQDGKENPFVLDPTLVDRAYFSDAPDVLLATGMPTAWINEFHYDNPSTDAGEFVEVVVEAPWAYDLSKLTLSLYNGNDGERYASFPVAGFTPGEEADGYTVYHYDHAGIQNGPDGLALAYDGVLIPSQFLSYEGAFAGVEGPAMDAMSTDIGVREASPGYATGSSLQLRGAGGAYANYAWAEPSPASPGQFNAGQTVAAPVYVAELAGPEGWRLLAAPSARATVDSLLGGLWTRGFPGADAEPGRPDLASAHFYDESASGSLVDGWAAPDSQGVYLQSGRGLAVYVFEQDLAAAAALRSVGPAPAAPFALPLRYTATGDAERDGWNLVGNPFAEPLCWFEGGVDAAGVERAVYLWDAAAADYRTYNGLGADGTVCVPAFAAFWVKADALNPSARLAQAGGVRTPGTSVPEVAFTLRGEVGGLARQAEARVQLAEGATPGRDALDAVELTPHADTYLQLYTRPAEGPALDRDVRPTEATTVALGLAAVADAAPAEAELTLTWDAVALPAGWSAVLHDTDTGARIDLLAEAEYRFTHEAGAAAPEEPAVAGPWPHGLATEATGRFSLELGPAAVGTEPDALGALALEAFPNPFRGAATVRYTLPAASDVRLTVLDVLGREVAVLAEGSQTPGPHALRLDARAWASGLYVVRLVASGAVHTKRLTRVR